MKPIHSTIRVSFLALVVISLGATRARAQETLPFTAGQWGIEAAASSIPEGGMIRFLSSRTALTLSGSYSTLSVEDERTDPFTGATFTMKTTQSLADVRVGMRFYRPVASSVVQFTGVGLLAQHVSAKNVDVFTSTPVTDRATGIGAFAEVGAQYHLSAKFSIGAAVRAEYIHLSGKTRGDAEGRSTGNGFAVEFAPIRASIFF